MVYKSDCYFCDFYWHFLIMCNQGPQPSMFQVTMTLDHSHYNKQPLPPPLPLTPQSYQDATMATTPLCNVNKMILKSNTAHRYITLCVAVPNLTALTFPFRGLVVKKGIWALYSQPNFQGTRNILHVSDSKYYEEEVASTSSSIMSVKPLVGEIILYEHRNYNGASLVLTESAPDLRAYGWNDRASSVRVISGKWRLYNGVGYRPRSFTTTGNPQSLPRIRLNNAISSVRLLWSS